MRLTPELIASCPSYLNPLKDRQLDLRGHKIPAIENLGVAKDQHDTIDLTDNSLTALSNLPLSPRLRTLILANNSIHAIHPSIQQSVPNLNTLILTNNAFAEPGDLEVLGKCRNLEYLSLLGCPVREKKWYRPWMIFVSKSLRVLDFERIKDRERKAANQLFLTPDKLPTSLATSLSATRTSAAAALAAQTNESLVSATARSIAPGASGRLMTAAEKERIKEAIKASKNAEEVRKLEQQLREGYIPV